MFLINANYFGIFLFFAYFFSFMQLFVVLAKVGKLTNITFRTAGYTNISAMQN